jgi:cell division protein FtsW
MAKRVSVDRWMFTVTTILVFIGLVMIFSASAVMAKERFGSAYEFLLKQLVWAVAGLLVMVIAMKVDYKRLQHPALVFLLLGFTTLLLISVFFLDRSHGTHRWLHLGPVSMQPSELAKPALILFLAWFLENKTKAMDDWRNTLLPAVAPTCLFILLIVFVDGRNHGAGVDGRETETILSSGATHRFYFRGDGGRVGAGGRAGGGSAVCDFSLAWDAGGVTNAG